MSDFIAITYRQSEEFNLEIVERDCQCFVQISAPRYANSEHFKVVEMPVIRMVTNFVKAVHGDGDVTKCYIFEVRDFLDFYKDAITGSLSCGSKISKI